MSMLTYLRPTCVCPISTSVPIPQGKAGRSTLPLWKQQSREIAHGYRFYANTNHQIYAIPIHVIDRSPNIRDLATNTPVIRLVGWYFRLSKDVLITPEIDYLVVETRLGEYW